MSNKNESINEYIPKKFYNEYIMNSKIYLFKPMKI